MVVVVGGGVAVVGVACLLYIVVVTVLVLLVVVGVGRSWFHPGMLSPGCFARPVSPVVQMLSPGRVARMCLPLSAITRRCSWLPVGTCHCPLLPGASR